MKELDKEYKKLVIGGAISAHCHAEYLKSRGIRCSSVLAAIQEWEVEEISRSESELSIPVMMLTESIVLESIAKTLKHEAEELINKEEKQNEQIKERN